MKEEICKSIASVIPTIAGVVIGFVLSSGQRWFERRRKLRSHWASIRAEMALCKDLAETFITASIMAPLYRLPVTAIQTALPILLVEGHLNEHEVLILTKYSSQVQDIVRGFDNAAQCSFKEDESILMREYQRNLIKTRVLLNNANYMTAAKNIVDGKLLRWWEFL